MLKVFLQLYLPLISGLLLLGACKSNKQEVDKKVNIESIAKYALGGISSLTANSDETYMLAIMIHNNKIRPNAKSFTILNLKGEIVHKKTKVNGTVTWLDNTTVEVTTFPGIVKDEKDTLDKHTYTITLNIAEI